MSEDIGSITDQDFQDRVLNAEGPVLVDFWATWCEPCKRFEPTLKELASQFSGRLKVAKLNVEESPQTARQFMVRGLPTFIIFKGGKPHAQQTGALSKGQMVNFIERAIA
jgi:thioredoxin 1